MPVVLIVLLIAIPVACAVFLATLGPRLLAQYRRLPKNWRAGGLFGAVIFGGITLYEALFGGLSRGGFAGVVILVTGLSFLPVAVLLGIGFASLRYRMIAGRWP
jgi:hypothetical protein